MNELKIVNLIKKYDKDNVALSGINYVFTNGIYGLLGANGAGKSTFMNILTTLIKKTNGDIYYNNKSIDIWGNEYKKFIGYMPQNARVYDGFSLEHFLYYMAALKDVDRRVVDNQVSELICKVNLDKYKNAKLGSFSGGMRQRALLAQALLGDPQIIVLDEPTAGLDPRERIRIRNLISEIAFNKIIIVATHIVSDIETIADNVIFLKKGEIINSGTVEDICINSGINVFECICDERELLEIRKDHIISNIHKEDNEIKIRVVGDECKNIKCEKTTPNLDDIYLYYYNEEYNDDIV